ncbi:MAG: hypothetical protein JXR32_04600 [Anaerolineaceae bacterium]|nr:hypothetical protein [Anaerolineaceae bacterium]
MLNFSAYDLLEACKEPGCPVCRLENRYVKSYLEHLFYESVNDPGLRKTLRLSMGFCPEHGWLAANQKLGDRLGFAIIYKDVINTTIKQLNREIKAPTRRWKKLRGIIPYKLITLMDRAAFTLSPKVRCPVCQNQEKMLAIIISSIIEKGSLQKMLDAIGNSEGLCFPHLARVFQEVKDPTICKKLIAIHLDKLNVVHKDLAEIIRKSDYRFVDEGMGKEAGAWKRALEITTGRMKSDK